jgi:hypothetical protein
MHRDAAHHSHARRRNRSMREGSPTDRCERVSHLSLLPHCIHPICKVKYAASPFEEQVDLCGSFPPLQQHGPVLLHLDGCDLGDLEALKFVHRRERLGTDLGTISSERIQQWHNARDCPGLDDILQIWLWIRFSCEGRKTVSSTRARNDKCVPPG